MLALFDLSTGHISRKTREWLDDTIKAEVEELPGRPIRGWLCSEPATGLVCFPCRHGWFLHVSEVSGLVDTTPADLVAVIAFAASIGADWINLDADAPRVDGLPFHDED